MAILLQTLNCCLEKVSKRLKTDFKEFQHELPKQPDFKRRRTELAIDDELTSLDEENIPGSSTKEIVNCDDRDGHKRCTLQNNVDVAMTLSNIFDTKDLSSWEICAFKEIIIGFLSCLEMEQNLFKSHLLLQSLWQSLHTGHWSQIPMGYRIAYSYASLVLVGFLLQKLLNFLKTIPISEEDIFKKGVQIVQACDRSLLMGKPLEKNPLQEVASILQRVLRESAIYPKYPQIPHPSPSPTDQIPEEASPFEGMAPLPSSRLPPLHHFLLTHMEGRVPQKLLGMADSWPALVKWDMNYFRKVAGLRTVPVEVGLRYTDVNWSQKLISMDDYLSTSIENTNRNPEGKWKISYLAQHQLLDQVPELLDDIVIPDYCHMGEKEPTINIWMGPKGTVTPIHHDPDHNILVQVYGYKNILIFPEEESKNLYSFEDPLLSNTSKVNLEEEVHTDDLFERRPFLRHLKGNYLTLGPGDALYLPPRWWHYVKSLSNSISVSFWWR